MSQADRRRTAWIIAVAAAAALAMRCWFIAGATVETPVRGDAREYVAYAANLAHFHVFSGATGQMPVSSDSYRDPGYPLFLTPLVAWIPDVALRYRWVAYLQATLGALTVVACLVMARRWLSPPWLAAVALLMVVWPHSVTMPAYLLSETLLGVLVAGGLAFLVEGFAQPRTRWLALGALLFGAAGLTNAVLAPFLPLTATAGWLARPDMRRQFAVVLLTSLLLPACWLARNLSIHESQRGNASSRAMINLVQGSWPEYHDAWHAALRNEPKSVAISQRIDEEVSTAVRDPVQGLADIAGRFQGRPAHYVAWYLSKPWLLWSWSMRIAAAPIYVFPTRNSPLDGNPVGRGSVAVARWINPWLALMALLGCLLSVTGRTPRTVLLPTLLVLYVTAVYGVFQSEPRYAVPFRGAEFVLAAAAAAWVNGRLTRRWPQRRYPHDQA